ncbi:MAG: C4-type zinc ribbon domain-containing protein [Candidatus Omnitrophica bacterium]|nr:C4-type zinc ribbon domain-containing protein [Candidatus Omnitrophota bacterium]
MATTIERLRDLQNSDRIIYRLKKRLAEIPVESEKLSDKFKKETEELVAKDKEVKKEEVTLRETESEVIGLEEEIKKAQRNLMNLKTNREYAALMSEIDGFKKKISNLEEHALLLMDNVVRAKKIRKEEEKRLEKEKGGLDEVLKVLAREESEKQAELSEEEKRRPVLSGAIPGEMLIAYERILKAKANRKALAGVKDNICTGCQTRLPTGTLDKLHKGADLVFCEGCNRLLYLE